MPCFISHKLRTSVTSARPVPAARWRHPARVQSETVARLAAGLGLLFVVCCLCFVMLKFLSVENFALIDRLEVEFRQGLNLITGETGSGKSILVDAVGLLVGGRASLEMVRQGFDQARVEGMFELSREHPARVFLADAEIPLEGGELIIRPKYLPVGIQQGLYQRGFEPTGYSFPAGDISSGYSRTA